VCDRDDDKARCARATAALLKLCQQPRGGRGECDLACRSPSLGDARLDFCAAVEARKETRKKEAVSEAVAKMGKYCRAFKKARHCESACRGGDEEACEIAERLRATPRP
jgi:hypothetical protein